MSTRDETILRLGRDRRLAHAALFSHRHLNATPEFHYEMIALWHSRLPAVSIMAFRGAAKSTTAEEAITIGAAYRLFRNAILVGSTEKRAVERLRAVKHELDTNEQLAKLFGPLGEHSAKIWNDAEVILANGVRIIAVGRGQSLRGTKHLQWRPDFCFCDDIEEVEPGKVYEDIEAEETIRWFMSVLMAALDRDARVRVNSTPLSAAALPFKLASLPQWTTRVYPIEHIDPNGERKATWEARYPLAWIDEEKDKYLRLGIYEDYLREYMCQAEDPKRKIFTSDMIKVEPRVRTWHPTFAFYDPARSVKSTSATTGWCVWSWIGNRLVVWDGGGELWKPDELVNHVFTVADDYSPVAIGVEEDGLNEFLMQPLRHEMVRRNFTVPVVPMKAPKGKLQFIEGLQPFFLSKEITFAKELIVLKQQFLSFPQGRIDGPNALAYALRMRPGQVIYEDFASEHVATGVRARRREKVYLALNAGSGFVTAVAVQYTGGAIHVLQDYVREGDPGAHMPDIVSCARLDLGIDELAFVAHPAAFGAYDTTGLRGAVARLPAELKRGGKIEDGREELRSRLRSRARGEPVFQASTDARWTLNALAAGYARAVGRDGRLAAEAAPGVYRVLMEGLEAFASLLKIGMMESAGRLNIQTTPAGQRYVSALPGQGETRDEKGAWLGTSRVRP